MTRPAKLGQAGNRRSGVIRNRTASGVAKLDHEIDSVLGEFSLVPFQIND